jgi:hypothetical protein
MQCGADVVPAFAFGQSQTYGWIRPGPPLVPAWAVAALSRRIGARRRARARAAAAPFLPPLGPLLCVGSACPKKNRV